MIVDLTFVHSYGITVLEDRPGGVPSCEQLYYPGASTVGGRDGVAVKVAPDAAECWIGIFGFGRFGGITGVYSCPNSRDLCVVSRGDGFIVSANNPHSWRSLWLLGIRDVRLVPHRGVMLFANWCQMQAYGSRGEVWSSSQVITDELEILDVSANSVRIRGWDGPTGDYIEKELDLLTGRPSGG